MASKWLLFALPLFCWACPVKAQAAAKSEPPSAEWPHFRGPTQQGASAQTGIPNAFPPEGMKQLWKAAVPTFGEGGHCLNGSPVVGLGMVFVQSNQDQGKSEGLFGFDLKDGKQLWALALNNSGQGNGTPAVDVATGRVFACTSGGQAGNTDRIPVSVHCVDARSGQEVWKVTHQKLGLPANAAGSVTPLLFENTVIITTNLKVFALSKDTGAVVWSWPEKFPELKADEPETGKMSAEEYNKLDKKAIKKPFATSSPVIGELGGKKVLAQSVRRVADTGYCASTVLLDPKTGKQVCVLPWVGSHHMTLIADNLLINTVYDGDASYTAYSHPMNLGIFKPTWKGETLEMQEIKRIPSFANRYTLCSGAVQNGRVYWRMGETLWCVEAASGNVCWKQPGVMGKAWPLTSTVVADGKAFHIDEDGNLRIIQDQGSKAQLILTQKVCAQTGSSPAIADGKLIVRDYAGGLACYELKPGAPAPKK